jgi:hypothetical protein
LSPEIHYLEGVFDVPDRRPPGTRCEDTNDVEAQLVEAHDEVVFLFCEELLGQKPYLGLLGRCRGLQWVPELRAPPHLDLDEDEGVLVADDKVDLTVTCTVVAP